LNPRPTLSSHSRTEYPIGGGQQRGASLNGGVLNGGGMQTIILPGGNDEPNLPRTALQS
jgi:hypothetical protein